MSSEALKTFMVERLLDLDPNLSEDEGSLMFTKVINPLVKRMGVDPLTVDIESFIIDKMDEAFPNLDVSSPGSVLRDALVMPLVLLLEPLRREVNYLRLQSSIEDVDALSEEEADALLSNLFVFRVDGDYARTIQRVYFSGAAEVSVDASIVFSTGDGVGFVPENTRTYSPSDMRKSGALYYLDIPVRCLAATSAGNLPKNTIRFVSGLSGVLRTFNTVASVGGITAEVNSDLLDRADRALSERSLNTKRGIETNLRDNFSDLVSVDVVGYGEPEMQRDILEGQVLATSEERVGPLIYLTNSFRSIPVFEVSTMTDTFVPFTNTLYLHNVPLAKVTAVSNAKFLRVFDGNGYFDDLQLSRVREVDEVSAPIVAEDTVGTTVDIVIRLKDFKIYPERGTLTAKSVSVPLLTNDALHAFNRYARDGSAHRLTVEVSGADVAVGAPLPATDYVTSAAMTGAPTSVEYGKDFLLMIAADTTNSKYTNAAYDASSEKLLTTFRMLPMDAWYTGNRLGVARSDAFMMDKSLSGYSGATSFAYTGEKAVSAASNTLRVIDCGAPAYTLAWDVTVTTPDDTRFDGTTLEAWSKNAGATMYAADSDGTALTVGDIASAAMGTYVLLEPSTNTWAARGVKAGHFISLGLARKALNSSPDANVLLPPGASLFWSGWGRVVSIDATNPHKLLAVGVDWFEVDDNALHEFDGSGPGAIRGQFDNTLATLELAPTAKWSHTITDNGVSHTDVTFTVLDNPGFGAGPLSLGVMGGIIITGVGGPGVTLVAQADGTMDMTAPGAFANVGTVDYSTGAIAVSILDAAIPFGTPVTFTYQYIMQDQYRLMWTVYEGQADIVTSDGVVKKSYTDLVLPPAYALDGGTYDVAHMSPAGYRADDAAVSGWFSTDAENHGIAADTTTNKQQGFWVRLGKSFTGTHPSLGKTPAEACQGAEVLDDIDNDAAFAAAKAHQPLYIKDRYTEMEATADVRTGPVSHTHILTMTSLPAQQGVKALGTPTGTPTYDITPDLENPHQHGGFLVPHPFGGKWDDAASNVSYLLTSYETGLNLQNQSVHLYESETVTTEPGGIQVSGIPGSTPFPGTFNGPIDVNPNEIHIGGMTDVYVIGSSTDSDVTDLLTMTPADLLGTEVVATGKDGNWIASSNILLSTILESAVLTEFGYGALQGHMGNYVVQLIDPPASTPTFFRILNNVAGGVIIDGEFSAGPFASVEWRLLKTCTTSLEAPVFVLQQGIAATTSAGSSSVTVDAITFTEDPTLVPLFLEIGSGTDKGEYAIESKLATSVTLTTPMQATTSALPYRIYRKQGAAVQLPLVRISDVSLSGDSAGIKVPYMHPVDAVASSFAGINNDPVTGTTATLSVVASFATLTDTSKSFVSLGVLVNDVIRLDNQAEGLKYFYVTAVTATILTLDRNISITADITNVTYTVGHPSVGNTTLYFQDPTYIEIGPDTVFSYVDPLGATRSFRPSPAEEATTYLSPQLSTDLQVTAATVLTADSVNYFKHGVEVGDEVTLLTRDLYTATFDSTNKANIACAGKTLMFSIDGSNHSVVFGGTDPRTIDDVAADINAAVGAYLTAVVVETVSLTSWRIEIKSRSLVEIVDEGSVGILTTLRWTVILNNHPTTLLGTFPISLIFYDTATSKVSLTLTGAALGAYVGAYVHVQIDRKKYQRVYPSEMVAQNVGLYTASVRLTSFDPLEADTTEAGQQLAVTGYTSFGYELVVDNNNYSYSQGEVVSIRVSPSILGASASSLENVYAVAGADTTISYDYSLLTYEVQDFLLDPENRVVNNNPLARHFLPAYPAMTINFRGGVAAGTVKDRVEEYLKTLYPNRDLELFDLTSVLSYLGVDYVAYPQEAAFLTHDENRKRSVARSKDVVSLNKKFHIMGDLGFVVINRIG